MNGILPKLIGDELQLGRGDFPFIGDEFIKQGLDEEGVPLDVEKAGGFFEGGTGIFAPEFGEPEADVHQIGNDVFQGLELTEEVFAKDEDQAQVERAVLIKFVEEAGGGGALEGVVDEEELLELIEDEDDGAAEGLLPFPDGDEKALGRGGETGALSRFEQGAAHEFGQRLVGRGGAGGDEGALLVETRGDACLHQAGFAGAGFAVKEGETMGKDAVSEALAFFGAPAEEGGVGSREGVEGFVGAGGQLALLEFEEAVGGFGVAGGLDFGFDGGGEVFEELEGGFFEGFDVLGGPVFVFDGVERFGDNGISLAAERAEVAGDGVVKAFEERAVEVIAEEDEGFGGKEGADDIADGGEAADEVVEVVFGDDEAVGLVNVALHFDEGDFGFVEEGDVGVADDEDVGFVELVERAFEDLVEAGGEDFGVGENGVGDELVERVGRPLAFADFFAQGGDEGVAAFEDFVVAGDGGEGAVGALIFDARGEGLGDLLDSRRVVRCAEGTADEEDGVVGGDEVGEAVGEAGHGGFCHELHELD